MENSREPQPQPQPQPQAQAEAEAAVRCPRCDSEKTKFCYYNNYSLTQPRYLCKSCRRYWTKGGTLRNVPPGGASRKPKPKRTRARNHAPKSQPPPPAEMTLPAPGTPPPACEGTTGGANWGGEPPSLTSLLLTGAGGFGVDSFMAPPPLLGDISVLSAVPPVDSSSWADIGGCAFP